MLCKASPVPDSPAKVVHGQIVYVQAGIYETGQIRHDGGAQEHNHPPIVHVNHLSLQS